MTAQSIAHYNLLEKIGEGGLGSVFRARDTRVGRTVALKTFPADPAAADGCPEALVSDARAAATRLSHPNIATLFDVGESDGMCYLAYEFVAGAPLRALMGGGPMNPLRALELGTQVADALAHAEANGLVHHGDLRPETIAVTSKGAAKVLECGMSRWTKGGALRRTAATDPDSLPADARAIVNYLSPEQALGAEIDIRSDFFSLGTILYEMLTGRNPFAAGTPQDAIVNVTRLQPPPPSSVNRGVPPELDRVIGKALAKDIAQRYDSAAILAADLRRISALIDQSRKSETDALPIDDRADRLPVGFWTIVAAAIAITALVLWWAVG